MITEGKIIIDCVCDQLQIKDVMISSSRPLKITDNFIGYDSGYLLESIPRIYSICGIAQVIAAQRAIENQKVTDVSMNVRIAQDLLISLESIREQIFRIGFQWPLLFELPRPDIQYPLLNGLFSEIKSQLFLFNDQWRWDSLANYQLSELVTKVKQFQAVVISDIFHHEINSWLAIESTQQLRDWCDHNNCLISSVCERLFDVETEFAKPDVMPLDSVELTNQALKEKLNSKISDQFIAQPDWQDTFYETGPSVSLKTDKCNFTADNVLLNRYIARLMNLADRVNSIAIQAQQLLDTAKEITTDGSGVAQVEAARGRLIHYAELTNDRISRYKILAPTEWNFHPNGVIKQSLVGVQAANIEALEMYCKWFIESIDPCVSYDLRIQ